MAISSGMPRLCYCTTSRQAMCQICAMCGHPGSVAIDPCIQAPERAKQLRGKPLSQGTRGVYASEGSRGSLQAAAS